VLSVTPSQRPWVIRCRRTRVYSAAGTFGAATLIIPVLVALLELRATITPVNFIFGVCFETALIISMIVTGALSARSGTIRLSEDCFVYQATFATTRIAKRNITSTGLGETSWRPGFTGLFLELSDGRQIWIRGFSAPSAVPTSGPYGGGRSYQELLLAKSEIDAWLAGRPRSPVRPASWT